MKKFMLIALLAAFAASPVVSGQAFASDTKKEHHGKPKHHDKKHEKPADAAPAHGQ